MTPRPALLTANEVAEEFRLDPETIRRWARQGRIERIKLPTGHYRFRRADIEAITGETPTPAEASAA